MNGGPFGSKLTSKRYTASGVPVIRGTNLSGPSKFSFEDFVFVSDETANELLANNAHPGDLVFTQRGTIGQVGLIPANSPFSRFVISQSQMKLTPDLEQVDPFYLYYYFSSPESVVEIRNLAMSSGVPHINLEILRGFNVVTPPLACQRSIANILSAYDDLIENCQRRIRILEDMARGLYREWFVHFRFPGADALPRVDSPLGLIPRGWVVMQLGGVCARMESGGTPRRNEASFWEGGTIPWFKTKELWDGHLLESEEQVTDFGLAKSSARLFEAGTILMAIYGAPTVGRLGILCGQGSCNQAALGMVAHDAVASQLFLYFSLFHLRDHFNGIAQGAAQQNISKEKVAGTSVRVPPRSLIAKFDTAAIPMFDQIRTLRLQITNLRRTRDLLLPRLLSGQIDVGVAESMAGVEAAEPAAAA